MARVLTLALLVVASAVVAQPLPPELTAPVNDFAGVIDPAVETQLSELSRNLEAATADALVVATVRTFSPYADLPSYAVKMFENRGRGIGSKGQDSGLLIVLAVDDRQVRVEVGYGLEGIVTDGFAGETSRDVMVPYFRRGEYGEGLLAGATRVAQRIAEAKNVTLNVQPPARRPERAARVRVSPLTILIVLYILYRLFRSSGPRGGLRGRRRRWSSGVGPFGAGAAWGSSSPWIGSSGGFGGGFGGFGGGRSGGGGGGASW